MQPFVTILFCLAALIAISPANGWRMQPHYRSGKEDSLNESKNKITIQIETVHNGEQEMEHEENDAGVPGNHGNDGNHEDQEHQGHHELQGEHEHNEEDDEEQGDHGHNPNHKLHGHHGHHGHHDQHDHHEHNVNNGQHGNQGHQRNGGFGNAQCYLDENGIMHCPTLPPHET